MTTPDELRELAEQPEPLGGTVRLAHVRKLRAALRSAAAQVERLMAERDAHKLALESAVHWRDAFAAERDRLRTLLRELRAPIKCSIFGMPADEVTKWIARIDTALAESEAK